MEHLAAKEIYTLFPSGVGGDQNRANRRVNIRLTFARNTTPNDANVALFLLDV